MVRKQAVNLKLILTQTVTNELLRTSRRGLFWKEGQFLSLFQNPTASHLLIIIVQSLLRTCDI